MERQAICAGCGAPFTRTQTTGRPQKFCSSRCRWNDCNHKRRDAEYASLARTLEATGTAVSVCRVCWTRPATRGTGSARILCEVCAPLLAAAIAA